MAAPASRATGERRRRRWLLWPPHGLWRTSRGAVTPSSSSSSCRRRPQPPAKKNHGGFPLFTGSCASGHGAAPVQRLDDSELCAQMMLRLRDIYDPSKVDVKVRVVAGSPSGGVVAGEAERAPASWVVLDRELKHEEKLCVQELQCNIVVMKRSRPKVVWLNLVARSSGVLRMVEPQPAGNVEEEETVWI